jgi:hypothetical protein
MRAATATKTVSSSKVTTSLLLGRSLAQWPHLFADLLTRVEQRGQYLFRRA